MPVPAIPPEVVEEILKQPPIDDAETVPTLLSCTLVSHSFSSIAKRDSLWKPIVRKLWSYGRLPSYRRFSNKKDRAQFNRAFPPERRESPSVHERIVARTAVKGIVDRHLAYLLADMSNKIPHLLAIAEFGAETALPMLQKMAQMRKSDDQLPPDWLARRHWARQVRQAIARGEAVDVWKRIGERWDGTEAFCRGVSAFGAFSEAFDYEAVIRDSFEAWEPRFLTHALPQLE